VLQTTNDLFHLQHQWNKMIKTNGCGIFLRDDKIVNIK